MFLDKNGKPLNVDANTQQGMLQSGTGSFDPNSDVHIVNSDGKVGTVKGSQVPNYVLSANSDWKIADPEDAQAYNDNVNYGSTADQAASFVAGMVNFPSFGLATKGLAAATNHPEIQNYVEKTSQVNPRASFLGGAVGGFADTLGTLGAVEDVAKAVVPGSASTIVNLATNPIRAAVAGAGYGAIEGLGDQVYDNQIFNKQFSGEALFNTMFGTAKEWGTIGAVLSPAVEGYSLLRSIKDDAAKNINKAVNTGSGSSNPPPPPSSSPTNIMEQARVDSPIDTGKATEFKVNTDPNGETYTHIDGDKTVKINPDNLSGKISDFTTNDGLLKTGAEIGVDDYNIKYKNLKMPDESISDFNKRMAKTQLAENFLRDQKQNQSLSQPQIDALDTYDHVSNMIKNQETVTPEQSQAFKDASQSVLDTASNLQETPLTDKKQFGQWLIHQQILEMSDDIKSLDHGNPYNKSTRSKYPQWFQNL